MRRLHLHIALFLGLLLLVVACKEEEYYYPSVKLEFVTVLSGADGKIVTLVPDKGEVLQVAKDRTNSSIGPNSSRRVMSNYDVVSTEGAGMMADVYSLQSVVAPEPKKANDPAFDDGLKTDPVKMMSIWMGRDYLNMILTVKVEGGKQHVFGIVEESVEETVVGKVVTLSLFHNAKGDNEYYDRRAYVSVPLTKYADEESDRPITIRFKYYTYGEGDKVLVTKYCEPGFEYIPDKY